MSMGRPRDPRKEQQWRERFERWRQSQLSVAAFCRREGIDPRRLYRWRSRLAARDAKQAAWVPVHVLTEVTPSDNTLEILLVGGPRVRVPRGFDATTLRQVLAVLAEDSPC